jgi:adenylate cyclase
MVALARNEAAQAAERAEAVFVYAELRGFTGMSEMLEAGVVLELLEAFHAFLEARCAAQGGRLVHRFGDTALLAFGGTGDAARAVRASQDALQAYATLESAWREAYGLHTAISLALHRGAAVFSPGQAIGDCVSLANRLLHRARAGEFVFSTAVLDALVADGVELDAEPLPPVEIPPRPPMRIYGVLLPERLDFT